MTGVETGATILKVGVAVIERAAPTGMEIVRSWLTGKQVVVVGPPRAGKSTFIDYLHYGLFEDEKDTSKTIDITATARFNVKIGRDSALQLLVSRAIDVPGQIGPVWQADVVFHTRPHAVLLMVDLSAPLDGTAEQATASWLEAYCKRLEAQWRAKGKRGNRTKTMIVIMNKADKVEASVIETHRKRYREIIDTQLRDARGKMLEDIAILPCVTVNNPNGTKSVDAVISHLAKALVAGG